MDVLVGVRERERPVRDLDAHFLERIRERPEFLVAEQPRVAERMRVRDRDLDVERREPHVEGERSSERAGLGRRRRVEPPRPERGVVLPHHRPCFDDQTFSGSPHSFTNPTACD